MRLANSIAAAAMAACALAGVAWANEAQERHGMALAEANCARCHAIGNDGDSPHALAPRFRDLSQRLPVETIDETLIAKATPKHSDMPQFTITPAQAGDIALYIASLQPEAHGRKLVEVNCAGCHAIGVGDASRHPDAPPFRRLSLRYPIDALEEALAEGIVTGHPDMPQFTAEPRQIADILAYIWSIQEK